MNILIIGNLGYIGPVVSQHLRRTFPDAQIEGFDIGYFAHLLTASGALPEAVLNAQHFGDVRQFPVELLRGRDAVIYLAAISNDPMGKEFEDVTLDVNSRACTAIAQAAREQGVRAFVLASSCSVYGAAGEGRRQETAPLNPLTAYARSKVEAEAGLAPLARDGFTISCLRFATACGFSPRLRLDLVLNDFVASALATGRIEILSDGTPWRPLIHVQDMARALEWAATRPSTAGGHFLIINVGANPWNYRVRELAEAVQAELGDVELSINTQAAPDKRSYQVDFSYYAELAPIHVPQVTLHQAVVGLRDGLRAINFNDSTFRDSTLMRLKVLQAHKTAGRLDEILQWQPAGCPPA